MANGSPPLHPSASSQVERIREVLMGRQMSQVEQRLQRLERGMERTTPNFGNTVPPEIHERLRVVQEHVMEETRTLREQVALEIAQCQQQIRELAQRAVHAPPAAPGSPETTVYQVVSQQVEELSAQMAQRIDARVGEVLVHLQNELRPWQQGLNSEFHRLGQSKADREELRARFARLARAAMADEDQPEPPPPND